MVRVTVFLVAMLVFGCSSPPATPTTSPAAPTSTPTPTATLTPTATQTPTPTPVPPTLLPVAQQREGSIDRLGDRERHSQLAQTDEDLAPAARLPQGE